MSQRSNRWECRKRDYRQIGGDYDFMKMNIVIPVKPGLVREAVPGRSVKARNLF